MRHLKSACQTIIWGDGQDQKFPEIFSVIADAGYQGVEIGWRRLQSIPPENLKRMLDAATLELSAIHIGGNLEDLTQAGQEKSMIDQILFYLKETGCSKLLYSGFSYKADSELDKLLEKDLKAISKAVETCSESGIKLLYHNHNWEFAQSWRIMKKIISAPLPSLGFCPDIGWLAKAHVNAIEFLDTIKDRLGMVHFKDFASFDDKVDPVELGTGIADLKGTINWLRKNVKTGMWIVAEQDISLIGPEKSAGLNAAYLKNVFSE